MTLSRYDAWVTREPDVWEPPPPLHCSGCGAFLPRAVERSEVKDDLLVCDGSETIHREPYTKGLIAILGEEYRGQSYAVSVSACGTEIGPHAAHTEVQWSWVENHRTCRRCGADNLEG